MMSVDFSIVLQEDYYQGPSDCSSFMQENSALADRKESAAAI